MRDRVREPGIETLTRYARGGAVDVPAVALRDHRESARPGRPGPAWRGWAVALALLALGGGSRPSVPQTPPEGLADTYLRALERVLAQDATVEDIERLTFLYAIDVVYEHPRAGARVRGRSEITEAMGDLLGKTRNPETRVHGKTRGEGVVVVDYTLEMETLTDSGLWRPIERRQITVLEVNADGRITRLLEYW